MFSFYGICCLMPNLRALHLVVGPKDRFLFFLKSRGFIFHISGWDPL